MKFTVIPNQLGTTKLKIKTILNSKENWNVTELTQSMEIKAGD
jgi:hypothetical protein